MPAISKMNRQAVYREISRLVRGFSIEILTKDAQNIARWRNKIPPNTAIYIAQLPNQTFDQVIDAAIKVHEAGLRVVPHLAVRRIQSKRYIRAQFVRMRVAGIHRILVIAGDTAVQNPVFDDSLALLQTGWLEEFGFTEIGVAAHPEGLVFMPDDLVMQVLLEKCEMAKHSSASFYLVTQFGLDPQNIIHWERKYRSAGGKLPIHAGMAGRIQAARLLAFAAKCGVGSSLQIASKNQRKMLAIGRKASAEKTIHALAISRLQQPESLITQIHFFPFGSFENTLHWASTR